MGRRRARNPVRRLEAALSKQHSNFRKGYHRRHQFVNVVIHDLHNIHRSIDAGEGSSSLGRGDNEPMDFSVIGDLDDAVVDVVVDDVNDDDDGTQEEEMVSETVNLELDEEQLLIEEVCNPQETTPYNNCRATSSKVGESFQRNDLTFRVMTDFYLLGMKRGASIDFMNDIVSLFRQAAKDGFDMRTAPLRDTFLKNAREHLGTMSAPPIPEYVMVSKGGPWLPKFNLLDQIRDLMVSSEFQKVENLVVNKDPAFRFHKYVVPDDEQLLEVNSGRWYSETYDKLGIDPTQDWLFPLIFYIDKTGTDALQRFPLEPLMFTTTVLRREIREHASAWRHLGFIPTCDDEVGLRSPRGTMQLFHQCLSVLLQDLVTLQSSPPTIEFSIDGVPVRRRLILPVAFVMGDQLSQDKHCGRKAVNGGGAGKVHRRCMTSSMAASSTEHRCKLVSKQHIETIHAITLKKEEIDEEVDKRLPPPATQKQKQALRSYLERRSRFATSVLEKVYSMYPIKNAWSVIDFGANPEGIFRASMDDPMHYCDSGTFLYLAQVVFLSMTESERTGIEKIIRLYFQGKRSSVRDDLPRGKFTAGFTRTTLLTAGEKIGLILSLLVCLGTEQGSAVFTRVLRRVQRKYETFPPPGSSSQPYGYPKRGDVHFFADLRHDSNQKQEGGKRRLKRMDRSLLGIQKMLKSVVRHELGFMLKVVEGQQLDELQTEYFLQSVHKILGEQHSVRTLKYPETAIPGLYQVQQDNFGLSVEDRAHALYLHSRIRKGNDPHQRDVSSSGCVVEEKEQLRDQEEEDDDDDDEDDIEEGSISSSSTSPVVGQVKQHIPKHGLVRAKVKGNGETSAILTDIPGFRRLLTRALSFHSFIHYFEEISPEQRVDIEGIRQSLCEYVKEYCRCVYRGDDSTDCDTCKVHCHLHLDTDIRDYGHPMNWEAGKGERGLKVWAKLASTTAQKQSLTVFTYQTALRVAEASLLTKVAEASLMTKVMTKTKITPQNIDEESQQDSLRKRKEPHFLLNLRDGTVKKVTKRGRQHDLPNRRINGIEVPDKLIHVAVLDSVRRYEGRAGTLKIWKDVVLRAEEGEMRVRACTQYDRFGAFFDWVSVQSDVHDPSSCYPAKLLLVYDDQQSVPCAIVHACEWRNEHERLAATALTQRWSLEFADGKIVLRKICLSDIVGRLYCIEHTGEKPDSMGLNVPVRDRSRRKYTIDVVEPRYAWAQAFLSKSNVKN